MGFLDTARKRVEDLFRGGNDEVKGGIDKSAEAMLDQAGSDAHLDRPMESAQDAVRDLDE